MTNNSGKFIDVVSAKEPDVTVEEMAVQIPAAPSGFSFMEYVEEYLGKWWWVWLCLLLILKSN